MFTFFGVGWIVINPTALDPLPRFKNFNFGLAVYCSFI